MLGVAQKQQPRGGRIPGVVGVLHVGLNLRGGRAGFGGGPHLGAQPPLHLPVAQRAGGRGKGRVGDDQQVRAVTVDRVGRTLGFRVFQHGGVDQGVSVDWHKGVRQQREIVEKGVLAPFEDDPDSDLVVDFKLSQSGVVAEIGGPDLVESNAAQHALPAQVSQILRRKGVLVVGRFVPDELRIGIHRVGHRRLQGHEQNVVDHFGRGFLYVNADRGADGHGKGARHVGDGRGTEFAVGRPFGVMHGGEDFAGLFDLTPGHVLRIKPDFNLVLSDQIDRDVVPVGRLENAPAFAGASRSLISLILRAPQSQKDGHQYDCRPDEPPFLGCFQCPASPMSNDFSHKS